jgi:T5SS/PEP-CTERM-associated repeat protein
VLPVDTNGALVVNNSAVVATNSELFIGNMGGSASMTISNGGDVYSRYGYLGVSGSSSNNSALVAGPESVWNNLVDLYVGYSGSGNALTVTNGGTVFDSVGYLGFVSSNNVAIIAGPNSVWSNVVDLYVGDSGSGNALTVTNGGTVRSGDGFLGSSGRSSNNVAVITGPGSVWSNSANLYVGNSGSRNTLTITNAATVVAPTVFIGGNAGANNNAVSVTGPGSACNNSSSLYVGYGGISNTLTIANGGGVSNAFGYIGSTAGAQSNAVTVTGAGSVWNNSSSLDVGVLGSGNTLTITNGGAVTVGGTMAISASGSSNNIVNMTGGQLTVTNGAINVGTGTFNIDGGTVLAKQLRAINANSVVTFSAGTLSSAGTYVTNSQLFVVGDGIDAATFQLNGGVHNFASDLEIANNATLTGCGTINGNVTIGAGGTVLINCGTLTFTGIVTNYGTMRAIEGSTLEGFGTVVNYATIDTINGATNFHGAFINDGTVLTASSVKISQMSRSGQDWLIQIQSVTGHTYQLQYTSSMTPTNWNDLDASQPGNGSVLTFTDLVAVSSQRFYRIEVTAP